MWSAHAPRNPIVSDQSAEHAVAADRFAREIVGFLTVCAALAAAERQSVRHPWQRDSLPFLIVMQRVALLERTLFRLRRAGARYAGVVRMLVVRKVRYAGVVQRHVVLSARSRHRDRVLRVVLIEARRAERDRVLGVIPPERPLCQVWFHSGVVSACGWRVSELTGSPNTPL